VRAHSVKPFVIFHLGVGVRLALRKLAPILAVAFAAYYLLRPELFNAIFAALLERGSLLMGLVSTLLSLSVAAMAAPRICLGLNGWIRHLPARGLTHRRLAGIAITTAQTPVLLLLAVLSLFAFAVFQVSPFLYLLGLPILGLASGLFVLPLQRNCFSKPLSFAACVLSTSGHWIFLTIAIVLLIIADLTAGSLSPSRKSRVSQRSLPGSLTNVIIVLRALRLRILFPYLPALFVLGLTSLFLSNNTLTLHQIFRGVIFGGTLSVSMLCAFIANSLAVRRPPWPWARSLPWSAQQRITTDASLIGLSAIPILFLVMLIKLQAIWPVAICIPPLVFFASLSVRRAFENQLGAVWQILIVGTTASVLVCLIPLISIVFLAMTPQLIKYGAEQEKQQKVSRWLEMHHLAAGDSLSWSRQ
jgi:uncharacterized membrane protein YvlD (DUF360 family)